VLPPPVEEVTKPVPRRWTDRKDIEPAMMIAEAGGPGATGAQLIPTLNARAIMPAVQVPNPVPPVIPLSAIPIPMAAAITPVPIRIIPQTQLIQIVEASVLLPLHPLHPLHLRPLRQIHQAVLPFL